MKRKESFTFQMKNSNCELGWFQLLFSLLKCLFLLEAKRKMQIRRGKVMKRLLRVYLPRCSTTRTSSDKVIGIYRCVKEGNPGTIYVPVTNRGPEHIQHYNIKPQLWQVVTHRRLPVLLLSTVSDRFSSSSLLHLKSNPVSVVMTTISVNDP